VVTDGGDFGHVDPAGGGARLDRLRAHDRRLPGIEREDHNLVAKNVAYDFCRTGKVAAPSIDTADARSGERRT